MKPGWLGPDLDPGPAPDPPPPDPIDVGPSHFADQEEGSVHVLEPGRYVDREGVRVQGPASRIEIVAYDEYLASTSGSTSDISDPALVNIMGLYDQMAIEPIVDQVRVPGGSTLSLAVEIWHSGDGIHWIRKAGPPAIQAFPCSPTAPTYIPFGYDDGTKPALGFVRLLLTLTTVPNAGPISAHIQIKVTLNDVSEMAFARALEKEFKREHKGLPLEYWKSPKQRGTECMKGLTSVTTAGAPHAALTPEQDHWRKRCVALGMSKTWTNRTISALKQHDQEAAAEAASIDPATETDTGGYYGPFHAVTNKAC